MKFAAQLIALLLIALSWLHNAGAQPNNEWAWTKEKWTSSDTPYLKVREAIGPLYRAKKLNDKQLKICEKAALQKPKDALALFRWGYYGFCLALLQPDVTIGSGKVGKASQAFANGPTPRSYEYTRLRYLMLSYLLQSGPNMAELSERLLKRNRNDYFVKYYAVSHHFTGKPKDEALALKLVNELVEAEPQNALVVGLRGYLYQRWWWRYRKMEDARKSIENYQRYLELADFPAGDIHRRRTENNIKRLQEQLQKALQNSKG
ncbi:MAG TPA: hypothetical protein VGB77_06050 [Abditibacteriaceae bacterium]